MRIYENGSYREMTAQETAALADMAARAAAGEKKRPLTQQEVSDLFIRAQVNAVEVDDQTSLRMMGYYPCFEETVGQAVGQGFKFTHGGRLYKTAQALTLQAHYPPGTGTESLYTVIDEAHDGSKYDPIPYGGNMALEADKYYTQEGVTYLCSRDTGTAVFNPLAELVGIYVEVAENGI